LAQLSDQISLPSPISFYYTYHLNNVVRKVTEHNGSGQNGMDKMVQTKWYTDKWYWTTWNEQNGMDKTVAISV